MTVVPITPSPGSWSVRSAGDDTAHAHLSRDRCHRCHRCHRYNRWLSRDRCDRCQFKKPYHYSLFENRARQERHPTPLQPDPEHLVVAARPANSLPLRERSLCRSLRPGAQNSHPTRRETSLSVCRGVVSAARSRSAWSVVGNGCCRLTTHDRPTLNPDRWATYGPRSVLRSRENPAMSEHRSRDATTPRTRGVVPEVNPLDQSAHPIREVC